jgi:hypothetical protein
MVKAQVAAVVLDDDRGMYGHEFIEPAEVFGLPCDALGIGNKEQSVGASLGDSPYR